ncbi:MAG: PEP-CTERM sorting domain-containing protein [Pirellulales bacterium]|nr:PEP-CTERM sorting domain-containing protein [Pirellulales bacterium]
MFSMFRKTMVVVCATALVGVFAGQAAADFIYDFDSNVGQTLTVDQPLDGQDGWTRAAGGGGTAGEFDYVRQETEGYWSTKHIAAAPTVDYGGTRINDSNWSYSIQEDVDFDMSAVFYSEGSNQVYSIASLAFVHDPLGYKFPFLVGIRNGNFWWFAREGEFGDIKVNFEPDLPTLNANIYRVGMEVTALGDGDYLIKGYYEDLTADPGTKVYVAGAEGNAHFDTFDVFDRLHFSVQSLGTTVTARMDDFRIEQIPEPSTLALLGCGLVGLLAYAWRKRK